MRRVALRLFLVLGLVACTGDPDRPADEPDEPDVLDVLDVAWVESPLPPAPEGWRVAVRDAAWCGDHWLVVGGVLTSGGEYGDRSRPAAWTSPDGARWTRVPIRAQTYYGRAALLTSVACRGRSAAAVGARPGGAHANPRTTTFRSTADGSWVDVEAPVTQYGGEQAVNVGPVASGPRGWLIAGNRVRGPAVWVGRTPRDFDLVEGAPGLADDGHVRAIAQDVTWSGRSWVVVGGAHVGDRPGREPQAWVSTDGHRWTRETVAATGGYADLVAAVRTPGGVLAVGLRDRRFAAWVRTATGWREGPAFGELAEDVHSSPGVASLSAHADNVWVTVSDGARYRLFTARDDLAWTEVGVPQAPETSGDHALSVAAGPDAVLLLADDGSLGRVWLSVG